MESLGNDDFSPNVWNAWKRRFVFWIGAILLGLVAVIFAKMADVSNSQFNQWQQQYPSLPFLITPLGFALISIVTVKIFPNAQGSGVPQTIAAISENSFAKRQQLLSLKIALGKVLLCCLAILCGASMGREGPTVHIGASLFLWVGTLAQFPRHDLDKGLILAGGAAGVAAAFNTPLAGIVFAIEELSRSFDAKTSGSVISAVLIAGTTAIFILGRYTYFGQSHVLLDVNLIAFLIVVKTGIVSGVAGGFFALALIRLTQFIAPYLKKHPLIVPAGCGLVVATIGYFTNGTTFGTGYEETRLILEHPEAVGILYPLGKMGATLSSALSGVPGGFFAPSLATGAGIGGVLSGLYPPEYGQAFVLLGMVGFFAGMIHAPITAFVIITEMTDNHEMLLPLMGTAFIAYGVSKLINPEPVYKALAIAFIKNG